MLVLRNVSKTYGKTQVLKPLDVEVGRGKTLVLIGPSGCGKSTLIRMMMGLIPVTTGQVEFDGERLTADNVLTMRQRMGYVIQSGGLFPHLTARRNVTIMARHIGWTDDRISKRVEELAELARLKLELLDRFPRQLSGGQRQRVSLMRALMLDPDLLFLDEPLGALDPLVRAELQDDLRSAFRELKKTVVMVTHDMGEAWFFGDSVALMKAGVIVQQGAVADFVRAPADPFVTDFINAQRSPMEELRLEQERASESGETP